MDDQKSQLLHQTRTGLPEELQERFLIKRIEEKDIEISLNERDGILKALNEGQRFIQIGKYTLMLNSIKSIDPKFGKNNTPPRPTEQLELVDGVATQTEDSKRLTKMWDELYDKRRI